MDIQLHGKLRVGYIDGETWKIYNPTRHRFKYLSAGKKRVKSRINNAYFYCRLDDERCIIPKHGSTSNFASVPRLLRRKFPPTGDGAKKAYGYACIIHDEMYRTHEVVDKYWKTTKPIEREEADLIFREIMKINGVDALTRWLLYKAVRLFGKKAWKKGKRPGSLL